MAGGVDRQVGYRGIESRPNVDISVALESYKLALPAFTTNGLATDKEVEDFLRADAKVLKLKEPAPAAKIVDFSLQREVNQELGIK